MSSKKNVPEKGEGGMKTGGLKLRGKKFYKEENIFYRKLATDNVTEKLNYVDSASHLREITLRGLILLAVRPVQTSGKLLVGERRVDETNLIGEPQPRPGSSGLTVQPEGVLQGIHHSCKGGGGRIDPAACGSIWPGNPSEQALPAKASLGF